MRCVRRRWRRCCARLMMAGRRRCAGKRWARWPMVASSFGRRTARWRHGRRCRKYSGAVNICRWPPVRATSQHVIAFLRRHRDEAVLIVVPRFACTLMRHRPELPLGKAWGRGELIAENCAGRIFVNVFTGEDVVVPENGRILLSRLFAAFPVAMLRSVR